MSDGFKGKGTILSRGKLTGNFTFDGRVFIVGEGSQLEGTLVCDTLTLSQGAVSTAYVSADTIRVGDGASLKGSVHVKNLIVKPGALISGKISVVNEEANELTNDL